MFPFGSKGYKYGNTRQFVRLPAAWPVKCALDKTSSDLRITETTDVSAGGIALLVPQPVPIGSSIRLEVHTPPLGRAITAEGTVLRCEPTGREGYELGIRFTRIDPKDQADLNEAIQKFYSPGQRERQQGGTWWRRLR